MEQVSRTKSVTDLGWWSSDVECRGVIVIMTVSLATPLITSLSPSSHNPRMLSVVVACFLFDRSHSVAGSG